MMRKLPLKSNRAWQSEPVSAAVVKFSNELRKYSNEEGSYCSYI